MSGPTFPKAGAALRERPAALVDRWLQAFAHSPLRLPRTFEAAKISGASEGVVEALAGALGERGCSPGSPVLREAEKRLSFAGGTLASLGAAAFDVAAWVLALRDVVADVADPAERAGLGPLFDWLGAVALEGYTASREEVLRLRHRESLEEGTPVVNLGPELPAAFLVGDPERSVLESVFGRLILAIVRVGARAVVLGAAGLRQPTEPAVLASLAAFAHHKKTASILVAVAGLTPEAEGAWRDAAAGGAALAFAERFEDAFDQALARAGYALVRRH